MLLTVLHAYACCSTVVCVVSVSMNRGSLLWEPVRKTCIRKLWRCHRHTAPGCLPARHVLLCVHTTVLLLIKYMCCACPTCALAPYLRRWLRQAANERCILDGHHVLCAAVEAALSADDLLYSVPGAAMVRGLPKLCQPPVYLDGYHAHAGEPFVCLHVAARKPILW